MTDTRIDAPATASRELQSLLNTCPRCEVLELPAKKPRGFLSYWLRWTIWQGWLLPAWRRIRRWQKMRRKKNRP